VGALPALAQTAPTSPTTTVSSDCSAIRFSLANPTAGSMVQPGGYVLQGVASDSRAVQGPGVDHVDFFLDNRDQGGLSLGTAVPGMVPGPFGPDTFQTTVTLPNMTGGHDLFAYAHSSVNGAESVISVPVALNEDPSKAFINPATQEISTATCMPGSTGMTSTMPAPGPASVAPTTPATTTTTAPATTIVSPAASSITLDVGNPSPGDTIHVGGYTVQGNAVDKAAQSGSGIDRIDIFLDSRDSGGVLLTEASFGMSDTWHATISIPANQTGLHELWFYAHSSVTGQESAVSVPVTVAP
jgi:hypothetical protein